VSYGKNCFTTLVEVKTGRNQLTKEQVKAYLKTARREKFDHVITISNQIAAGGAHPVRGLGVNQNSRVKVTHWSWMRILATALRLKNHTGVDDPEQAWILGELVRYMQHEKSGVLPLAGMGEHWSSVRDSARAGTLNMRSEGVKEVAERIDEMHTFATLMLSTEIGEDVVLRGREHNHPREKRVKAYQKRIVDGKAVNATFRIPNTAGDIQTEIDLKAQQLTASIQVGAPENKRARGRIGWIISQLKSAGDDLVIDSFAKKARNPTSSALVEDVRLDRTVLLGDARVEPARFVIKRRVGMPTASRSGGRNPGFIDGYMDLLSQFYETVVQDLKAWRPPAPRTIRETAPELDSQEDNESELVWPWNDMR